MYSQMCCAQTFIQSFFLHPVGQEEGAHRRHATVSPPRGLSGEVLEEKKDLAVLTSSPERCQVSLSEDKSTSVVMFHNDRDALVTLSEAGALAGQGDVMLRHKVISNLQKEELGEGASHSTSSSLVLQRTGSGPSPRKVSAEVVMRRTSSGSFVKKTSRPSTGTSPFRKSRFSVSSILSRKSVDLDAEKENLILDQDGEAAASPGEEGGAM